MTMTWEALLRDAKIEDIDKEPEAAGTDGGEKKDGDEDKRLGRYFINSFELDYNRIVTSAAFRRLQDKTRVFPLSKSDFVRTRLTHSIEVSTVAYQLGEMLINSESEYKNDVVKASKKELSQPECRYIPSVLRCAGLIHDLGNPPFGHFGEETIGMWFHENLGNEKYAYKGTLLKDVLKDPRMIADLEHFEGNAQALRLLCKARYSGDIDVSCAVISSLVKYPTDSVTSADFNKKRRADKSLPDDIRLHKPGIYKAEAEIFHKVAKTVGTILDDGTYCHHPLTYLMEASDDIAYATSDLEDAYKKKLFTVDAFVRYFEKRLEKYSRDPKNGLPEDLGAALTDADRKTRTKARFDIGGKLSGKPKKKFEQAWYANDSLMELKSRLEARRAQSGDLDSAGESAVFSEWLGYVRRWLMYTVAYKFSVNYDSIMAGAFREDMFEGEFSELLLDILKGAMRKFVYDTRELAPTELSGRTILGSLLDGFVRAALYYDLGEEDVRAGFVPTQEDKKYLGLISDSFKQDYRRSKTGDEAHDLYLRLLMVTDHVSSMTDAYARDLYWRLRGME